MAYDVMRDGLRLRTMMDIGTDQAGLEKMKRAIRTLGWRFNADRMVMDYVRLFYLPAAGARSSDMERW